MTQFDNCLTGRNMVAFGLPEIYSFDKIKSKIVLRKREAITCVVVRFILDYRSINDLREVQAKRYWNPNMCLYCESQKER